LFQYNNISVSVKDSVGRWSTSFTSPLLDSSNAFLARILANENAEILGSLDCGMSIFTAGLRIVGAVTIASSSFC